MDLNESRNSEFINIEEGVLRICLVSTINSELFPIGFFGSEWLKIEKSRLGEFSLRLEALNEVKFKITSSCDSIKKIDSIFHNNWLLILCMIKSSNQIEIRICRLIAILVFSFGKRNKESYTLPFELSHSQIALLVGCTRSTVTRQLGFLKEKGLISSDKNNNGMLISEKLIVQESIFVDHLQFNWSISATSTMTTFPLWTFRFFATFFLAKKGDNWKSFWNFFDPKAFLWTLNSRHSNHLEIDSHYTWSKAHRTNNVTWRNSQKSQ